MARFDRLSKQCSRPCHSLAPGIGVRAFRLEKRLEDKDFPGVDSLTLSGTNGWQSKTCFPAVHFTFSSQPWVSGA